MSTAQDNLGVKVKCGDPVLNILGKEEHLSRERTWKFEVLLSWSEDAHCGLACVQMTPWHVGFYAFRVMGVELGVGSINRTGFVCVWECWGGGYQLELILGVWEDVTMGGGGGWLELFFEMWEDVRIGGWGRGVWLELFLKCGRMLELGGYKYN